MTEMGVSIGAQTISITASAVLGLAAGLLYDILRQIRAVSGLLPLPCIWTASAHLFTHFLGFVGKKRWIS